MVDVRVKSQGGGGAAKRAPRAAKCPKGNNRQNQVQPVVESNVAMQSAVNDPVANGQGITTDCFNNLLADFTKALTATNSQNADPVVNQNQMLCEMGKFFISSMMTFNKILQEQGANTANKVTATEAFNDGQQRETLNNQTNQGTSNEKKAVKFVKRKAGREVSNQKDIGGITIGSVANVRRDLVADVISSVGEKASKQNNLLQRGKKGNAKKLPTAPKLGPDVKNRGFSDPKKQVTKKQPEKDGVYVTRPAVSKDSSVTSTAEASPASVVAPTRAESRDDFNNAPTPNHNIGTVELTYLEELVSPEEKLNFSIYQFVDRCTKNNTNTYDDKEGQHGNKNEWGNANATITKAPSSTADGVDETCRASRVVQSPAELLRAAFIGDVELLEAQESVDVNHVDEVGRSALHYACASRSLKCVECLLSRGIDINLADRKGWTAVHIAVSKNFTEVANVLINHGADIYALLKHKCAPARLTDVYSPAIHFAAIKGNIEITKTLMSKGVSINTPDSANMMPLHYAAFRGNTEYVKFLLDNGATINVRDVNGRTPFHAAALSGMIENVKLMVEKHPFVNEGDVWSLTPYKLAELRNHTAFVAYLNDVLHIEEDEENDINRVISSTIAVALQEPNADQIYRCVTRIGAELCKTVFDLTMQIERNGGVLTADGSRRRTSGGIFFTCLRELYLNDIISKEDYNYIRAAESEKRIARANERKNKLRAKV
ncbi:ankyrin repeat domain containing protein [Babesia gibsoni]|uniref:Ankyrin repeat domain containing protein n=1 Tax=Babesia gibsoni TaxID=33632 RepID=A0AAD8LP52_BABGI|nr:ankyrin repeat domain containing protein [Babesia gibsoni]